MSIAARPHGRAIEPSSLVAHTRWLLAASGFVMLGFVIVHLGGNLLAVAGGATFNAYARSIREVGAGVVGEGTMLLVARVVLATALALHVATHLMLQRHPDEAPSTTAYAPVAPWFATLPVSVLQATGGVIALFLVLHIAQLTIGALHGSFVPENPYQNLVVALQFWPMAILYVTAAAAVGIHLLAGTWTGMNSLGLIGPRTERLAGNAAPAVALGVTLGLAAVPVAVLFRVLT